MIKSIEDEFAGFEVVKPAPATAKPPAGFEGFEVVSRPPAQPATAIQTPSQDEFAGFELVQPAPAQRQIMSPYLRGVSEGTIKDEAAQDERRGDMLGYAPELALAMTTQVADFPLGLVRGLRDTTRSLLSLAIGEKNTENMEKAIYKIPILGKIWEEESKFVDKFGQINKDAQALLRREAIERGGLPGAVAAELTQTVQNTLMFLKTVKALGVGYGGQQGIKSTLQSAAVRSAFAAITAEDLSPKERLAALGWSMAYQSTPALSSTIGKWAQSDWIAKAADIAANAGISGLRVQRVIGDAHARAEAEGKPNLGGFYSTLELIKMFGADAVFGMMTTAFREQKSLPAQRATERLASEIKKAVQQYEQAKVQPPAAQVEDAGKPITPPPAPNQTPDKAATPLTNEGEAGVRVDGNAADAVKAQAVDDDYRGSHRAPTGEFGEGSLDAMDRTYPADIYDADSARIYGDGADARIDAKAATIIRRMRGKPESGVTVYRAVPKGTQANIQPGDWVTPIREYAEGHGERFDEGFELIERKVKAGELFTEGNSIFEYGWQPKQPAQTAAEPAKQPAPPVKESRTVAEPKAGDEGGVLSNLAKRRPNDKPGGIRWDIQNGKIDGLKAKELYRLSGSTEAIIEINGQRFTIDDATRLKFAGIKTDWSGRRSTPSSVKTERDWNDYLAKYPKLGKEDFAGYVKDGDRYVFKGSTPAPKDDEIALTAKEQAEIEAEAQADYAKPAELMTPEEWDDARPKIANNDWSLKTGRRNALKDAYQEKKPVNAMLAESVAAGEKGTRPLAVPEGYIREGDRYVFKGDASTPKDAEPVLTAKTPAQPEGVTARVEDLEYFAGMMTEISEKIKSGEIQYGKTVFEDPDWMAKNYEFGSNGPQFSRNLGAAYPAGWNKKRTKQLETAIKHIKENTPLTNIDHEVIKHAQKAAYEGFGETLEGPLENAKARGERNPEIVNEAELYNGDLVYRNGEWYKVKDIDGQKELADGATIRLDDFASVKAAVVIKPDHPDYKDAQQEYQSQLRAEKQAGGKAKKTLTQTEIPGAEDAFNLAGEDARQKMVDIETAGKERELAEAKARMDRQTPDMFGENTAAKPPTIKEIDDAVNVRARDNLMSEKGDYHVPGLRQADKITAGSMAYLVEKGEVTIDEWNTWISQARSENRFSDLDAPVRQPVPPSEKPEDIMAGIAKAFGSEQKPTEQSFNSLMDTLKKSRDAEGTRISEGEIRAALESDPSTGNKGRFKDMTPTEQAAAMGIMQRMAGERRISPGPGTPVADRLGIVTSMAAGEGTERLRGLLDTAKRSPTITPEAKVELRMQEPKYEQQQTRVIKDAVLDWFKADPADAATRVAEAEAMIRDPSQDLDTKGAVGVALAEHYRDTGNSRAQEQLINYFDPLMRGAGRLNQAASMLNALTGESWMKMVDKDLAKRGIELPPDIRTEVMKEFRDAAKIADETQRKEAIHATLSKVATYIPFRVGDWLDAYRYTNMLSNPLSHLRNVHGNIIQALVTRPLALIGSGNLKDAQTSWTSAWSQMLSGRALFDARQAFKTDFSKWAESLSDPNMSVLNAIRYAQGPQGSAREKRAWKTLSFIPKFLEAQDKFFGSIIEAGEMARLLSQNVDPDIARQSAKALSDEYLYRNPLQKQHDKSLNAFSQALDGFAYLIERGRTSDNRAISWPLKLAVPFLRTPVRIAQFAVNSSPLAFVGPRMTHDNIAKSKYNKAYADLEPAEQQIVHSERQNRVGLAAIGTMVSLVGYGFAAAGNTTWSVPQDQEAKKLFYSSGRRPYSFRVGNRWIPMMYLGPWFMAFALPAAAKDAFADNPRAVNQPALQKLGLAAAGIPAVILDQTPLSGVSHLIDALQGKIDRSTQSAIGFQLGQFVPASGLLRWMTKVTDPGYPKPVTIGESIQAGIPGLSNTLQHYLDETGDDATRPWTDIFLPYAVGKSDLEKEEAYQDRQLEIKFLLQAREDQRRRLKRAKEQSAP